MVFCRRDGDDVVITATDSKRTKEVARHKASERGQITLRDDHYPDRPSGPERPAKPTSRKEAEYLAIGEGAKRYLAEMAAAGERHLDQRLEEAIELSQKTDRGHLDEALGLAALAGRFDDGDLVSILRPRREPRRRIGEDHSLQPGTAGWARLGTDEK